MENLKQLPFSATNKVSLALKQIGRTEDVHFSPDNKRLALAGLANNQILILDIEIKTTSGKKNISLSDYLEISSPAFSYPHGIFWIDEQTLIVSNRQHETLILHIPDEKPLDRHIELTALHTLSANSVDMLDTPGSVTVSKVGENWLDVLICNNYAHNVSQHLLNVRDDFSTVCSSILLDDGLDIPDGIAISHDKNWIAVSNHNEHSVYVYKNLADLITHSQPVGILRDVSFPHGLRFTADDRFLLLADAGKPYVNIYSCAVNGWIGKFEPVMKLQVVEEPTFIRGQYNPQEGGPKGIDLACNDEILVTTCHEQPLAFFELTHVLQSIVESKSDNHRLETSDKPLHENHILIRHLHGLENSKKTLLEKHQQEIKTFYNSHSWRYTAPLRWLRASLFMKDMACICKNLRSAYWIKK